MDAQGVPLIPAACLTLLLLPPGAYGISYDISTRKTGNDLSEGSNSHRGELWILILSILPFTRLQEHMTKW